MVAMAADYWCAHDVAGLCMSDIHLMAHWGELSSSPPLSNGITTHRRLGGWEHQHTVYAHCQYSQEN